ncbi:hypothetical protein [Priestia megaterium]|uniref:hypothetical protein n=1 Tax=Priestia megaterium TaxID=1404 RepID=UPI0039902687
MDKFKDIAEYTCKHFYTFFDSISIYSINFLTWTSAVVVALLALTTIIFSQFNERLIQRSNDLSKEITIAILKQKDYQVVNEKINEIIYLLSNQLVYKVTLYFFFIISYLSGLLWLASGVGYILDRPQISLGDLVIIIFSLLAISTTFFVLPIILIQFNKNPPLKVDNKNRLSLDEILRYFSSINSISNETVINDYIKPNLNLSLNYSGILGISLKQEIPITKIAYIFEFVGSDNNKQIIKITNNSVERFNRYNIKPLNKSETSFEGLFNMIRSTTYQKLYVYSMDKKQLVSSFNLQFSLNTESRLALLIREQFQLTPDSYIVDVLNSKKPIHVVSEKNQQEYKKQYKLNKI